jgi:hypothetical protein
MGLAHGISREAMNASLGMDNRIKKVLCEAISGNSVISNIVLTTNSVNKNQDESIFQYNSKL